MVTGYSDPAVEGTNVTFSCHLGLVLTGPATITCTRGGQWKPDPNEMKCTGYDCNLETFKIMYNHNYIILGLTSVNTTSSNSMNDNFATILGSLFGVFFITTIIFFVLVIMAFIRTKRKG